MFAYSRCLILSNLSINFIICLHNAFCFPRGYLYFDFFFLYKSLFWFWLDIICEMKYLSCRLSLYLTKLFLTSRESHLTIHRFWTEPSEQYALSINNFVWLPPPLLFLFLSFIHDPIIGNLAYGIAIMLLSLYCCIVFNMLSCHLYSKRQTSSHIRLYFF